MHNKSRDMFINSALAESGKCRIKAGTDSTPKDDTACFYCSETISKYVLWLWCRSAEESRIPARVSVALSLYLHVFYISMVAGLSSMK